MEETESGTLTYDRNSDEHLNETSEPHQEEQENVPELRRNLIGFWFLGLCNNFGYVVMLSAAFDILSVQQGKKNIEHEGFHCNPSSTGIVLLADILPTVLVKLTAPFYMQNINYHIRVFVVIVLLVASLLTVAFSPSEAVSLLGVVFASLSAGLGEITFLSITSHFKTTTISAWSSGTGMAGVAGALSYAGLTALGISSHNTLLILLVVPVIFAVIFWIVIKMPSDIKLVPTAPEKAPLLISKPLLSNTGQDKTKYMSLTMKIKLIQPLLKYMIPLFLVYLAEYTINQGLYELLYYGNSPLSQASQYRWLQVDYQIGVFISRSSVNIFPLKKLFIPVIIQYCIFIFLLLEICFPFITYIWITLAIVFLEGLCGGAVYVNAFYLMSQEVSTDIREFSMGTASMADSLGIAVAGGISIPIHNGLCKLKLH